MAKILLVIAPEKFRDEELFETRAELVKAGHETIIASTKIGLCHGSQGGSAFAELLLSKAQTIDYAALVFVGGGGSAIYFADKNAFALIKAFAAAKKIVAAICLAPVILAKAGLLQGKKATVWWEDADEIIQQGAVYSPEAVVVDGNIITGNGPASAQLFGIKICELLKK